MYTRIKKILVIIINLESVVWENIRPGTNPNYAKQFLKVGHLTGNPAEALPVCAAADPGPYDNCRLNIWAESYGSCYDYSSIMHYSAFA